MRTFALMMALLIALPAAAQKSKNKTEINQPVFSAEGITYSLPRTGIRIILQARQTTFVPGPYSPYSEQLLGIEDVNTEKKTVWELSSVSFESYSEPDPEKTFKTGYMSSPLLQLTADGCLAGFNSAVSCENAIKTVSNSFVKKEHDQELTINNPVVSATSSGRTPVTQRAEEAAALILKSRKARFEIAAGMLDEFHPDGQAYQQSLEELEKTENETLELFTGKSVAENHTFVYSFIPSSKSVKGEVIFRFDENLGFLAKNDFSGKPVIIDVEREEVISGSSPAENTSVSGIYYRQPGMGNIRLSKELTVIGTARMAIAQFGDVFTIPAELLNGNYVIEFHPETGAIKSILKK